MPYRAGLEEVDRGKIQRALVDGTLSGVVSTSALELGLDIGDLDIVVLLESPPSAKSFWQRLGRAGRRRPGACLLIDSRGVVGTTPEKLSAYLQRPMESSWLYLANRYIQYANALCAAVELQDAGALRAPRTPFDSVPGQFRAFLENELDPKEAVAPDLYPLKQRAQSGAHHEFPVRNGVEPNFAIVSRDGSPMGNITLSQALREAYPGAVYYYMARPFRVQHFDQRKKRIELRPFKRWSTQPISQTMVFPRFPAGELAVLSSETGFVAEVEVQVSERCLGFMERRGGAQPEEHRYGQDSPHSTRPITRFFETSGVCWFFAQSAGVAGLDVAQRVADAFCVACSVQRRDIGVGLFTAQSSPLGLAKVQGACVYDSADGSLRLTQKLLENFAEVIPVAIELAAGEENGGQVTKALRALAAHTATLRPRELAGAASPSTSPGDWLRIVKTGQPAVLIGPDGTVDVKVRRFRYTPQGPGYDLEPEGSGSKWWVRMEEIHELHGVTECEQYNPLTDETRPDG